MTICSSTVLQFPMVKRRKVEVNFEGGEVTSDGGAILLQSIDKKLDLTKAVDKAMKDIRNKNKCIHTQLSMIRQRIYGLAAGYEDLNDHDVLRHDTAFQTAIENSHEPGSSATLCRMEQRANRETAIQMHGVLIEQFINSFKEAPKELVLDFDATDNPIHGGQVGRYFNKYYDCYCFLPLYVFCGDQLLVSYLRPASYGGDKHAAAILKLLVKRFREVWPNVKIVFRGDSGYCRPLLLHWCDRQGVDYVVGIAKNSRLLGMSAEIRAYVESLFSLTNKTQKQYNEFIYGARSWKMHERRVIVKAEHSAQGENPRFVVTSLKCNAEKIYTKVYCARGDMENRIKEQMSLFSGRTSCHAWWANQFRLLLSGFAYVLIERLRHFALKGTDLARAQVGTIRLKIIKIGGVIIKNTRRIKIMLSSSYPYQQLFEKIVATLNTC